MKKGTPKNRYVSCKQLTRACFYIKIISFLSFSLSIISHFNMRHPVRSLDHCVLSLGALCCKQINKIFSQEKERVSTQGFFSFEVFNPFLFASNSRAGAVQMIPFHHHHPFVVLFIVEMHGAPLNFEGFQNMCDLKSSDPK